MKHIHTLSLALLTALLAACGGGDTSSQEATRFAATPTLLDDEGRASSPVVGAEPKDPAARTTAGRYATSAQAQDLAAALGARALSIDAGCCNGDTELALGIVTGLQVADDLGSDVPVLVTGADQRLAARLADRLSAAGYTRVWLVTT